MKLDEAGLHSFADDQIDSYLAKRPDWLRIKTRVSELFAKPMIVKWSFSDDRRTRLQHLADHLATLYMLSSDFFTNGADESRTIHYVALYDPMRACGNPFARPVIVQTTATGA